MNRTIKILLAAFVLNFIWEISQAFLYAPHFIGIAGLIKVHIRASLGDVILVFLILLADIFIFSKIFAKEKLDWERISLIVLFGAVLDIAVEKYALASGRWAYDDLMPIVPFFNVGLTPVLQMMLLPALSILIGSGESKSRQNIL